MSGNTQRAPANLRILIVGEPGYPSAPSDASDSLAGLNTSELPDGAQAYVISTAATYRLHKTSTQAGLGNAAFIPSSNDVGVWFFESGAGSPFVFQDTGTASLTGAQVMTVNVWAQLPSGSGFYTTGFGGSVFTLNTTTGVVTYNGPNQRVRASAVATLLCATAAQAMELAITQNDFLIGATTFDATAGAASADPTTANLGVTLATSKVVTLANNDTLRAVMRNTTGTPGNMNCTHLNFSLAAA